MKIETLANRIVEKTGCPEIKEVLLGNGGKEMLPEKCIIWSGAMNGRYTARIKLNRDHNYLPYPALVRDVPRPVIMFQGKRRAVYSILFESVTSFEPGSYRLTNSCGNIRCVNPIHYTIEIFQTRNAQVSGSNQTGDGVSNNDPVLEELLQNGPPELSADWTFEDVEEVLEFTLDRHCPTTWEELIEINPDLSEAPVEMLSRVLTKIRKPHLMPAKGS